MTPQNIFTQYKLIPAALSCLLISTQSFANLYDAENTQLNNTFRSSVPANEFSIDNLVKGTPDSGNEFGANVSTKKDYATIRENLANKEFKKARVNIEELLQEHPNNTGLYYYFGSLEEAEKNYTKAEKNYIKAIEIDKNNIPAHTALAKLSLLRGDLNKASDYYNQILLIDKKNAHAYMQLAFIAQKKNNTSQVESNLLKAKQAVKGDFTAELAVTSVLGKWYVSQNQTDKYLIQAKELARNNPNKKQAQLLLAAAQDLSGFPDAAEKIMDKIIAKDSKDVKSRMLLVLLLVKQPNKQDKIIKLFDEIHAISPENSQYLVTKARYLTSQHQYSEAKKTAALIIKRLPNSPLGYIVKGEILRSENQIDNALSAYQKAFQIEPNMKLIPTITSLFLTQNQATKAHSWINELLKNNQHNPVLHQQLALVFEHQNNPAQAIHHYEQALKVAPDDLMSLNNLALLFLQQNNPAAIQLAKTAYEKAPQSAALADTYGYTLVRNNQQQAGLIILEKALALQKNSPRIQLHLAEAYLLTGNKSKGTTMLEKIIHSTADKNITLQAKSLLNK